MNFLLNNPIFIKCYRERLRRKQLTTNAIVAIILSLFVFLFAYFSVTDGKFIVDAKAAQATIIPLIMVQWLVLLIMGTDRIATGIAMEKDSGNLDFHRLTPMPEINKIIGFLIGLPVREYFIFLLILPFILVAVIIGEMSIYKMLLFYFVFFTSVWICHLAAFASGIISKKPRHVSSQVVLVIIGFYLLSFATWLTSAGFIRFLTAIPTFFSCVVAQIYPNFRENMPPVWNEGIWGDFFYTLITHLFFLFVFFTVVYRKWVNENWHAFSKKQSIIFFAYFQCLVLTYLGLMFPRKVFIAHSAGSIPVLSTFLFISWIFAMMFIEIITPNFDVYVKGLRRSKKLGLKAISSGTDAESNFIYVLGYSALTMAAYFILVFLGYSQHYVGLNLESFLSVYLLPPIFITALYLYIGFLRESSSKRDFLLFLFYLWLIPMFIVFLYDEITRNYTGNSVDYFAAISPIVTVFSSLSVRSFLFLICGTCFSIVLAVIFQIKHRYFQAKTHRILSI